MAPRVLNLSGSSNVQGASYDEERQELAVRFYNGSVYVYDGVPEMEASAFERAASPGSHVHNFLKPFYPARREI
jgi:hypothetical protein